MTAPSPIPIPLPRTEEELHAFVHKFVDDVPHLAHLGATFSGMGDDWAEMKMVYAPHLVAVPETGVIASGPIFSLMDTVSGFTVYAKLGHIEPLATLDLRVDYLRPAEPGKTVVARSQCYKLTRRVGFVHGIAHDGNPDHPIAHVSGTFMRTSVQ